MAAKNAREGKRHAVSQMWHGGGFLKRFRVSFKLEGDEERCFEAAENKAEFVRQAIEFYCRFDEILRGALEKLDGRLDSLEKSLAQGVPVAPRRSAGDFNADVESKLDSLIEKTLKF